MGVVAPYAPLAWVDNVTPDNAANMNHLEAGVANSVQAPTALAAGEAPVWTGAGWERSSVQKITRGSLDFGAGLVNADIAAAAGIVKSKLAALGIVDADVSAAAALAISKLAGYPADVLKALRGDGSWVSPVLYDSGYLAAPGLLDSGAGGITVPAWATSLRIKATVRSGNQAADNTAYIRINADAGLNYDYRTDGGGAGAVQGFAGNGVNAIPLASLLVGTGNPANYAGALDCTVHNIHPTSSLFRQLVGHFGAFASSPWDMGLWAQWRSLVAITRISLDPGAGNYAVGSRLVVIAEA